jgi:flagellar basal-body rod protein FlgB
MNAIKEHISFQASALSLRERRNTILASNIANATTPNYKARDVDFDREMSRQVGESPVFKELINILLEQNYMRIYTK